jgi:hypothetical protein
MKKAEKIIERLIKNPRMMWNEKIVMPSDKVVKNAKTSN